jgi:hypothetical protein
MLVSPLDAQISSIMTEIIPTTDPEQKRSTYSGNLQMEVCHDAVAQEPQQGAQPPQISKARSDSHLLPTSYRCNALPTEFIARLGPTQFAANQPQVDVTRSLSLPVDVRSMGSSSDILSSRRPSLSPAYASQDDWQFLTTLEKWNRWCSRTDRPGAKKHDSQLWRGPLQQATNDIFTIRCTHEAKRQRSKAVMRKMLAQGMHKTKAGLRLAASHLPKDVTAKSFNGRKYRLDVLDKVEQQSQRIQKIIDRTSAARIELKHCKQEMRAVEDKAKRDQVQEWIQQHHSDLDEMLHPGRKDHLARKVSINDFIEVEEAPSSNEEQ